MSQKKNQEYVIEINRLREENSELTKLEKIANEVVELKNQNEIMTEQLQAAQSVNTHLVQSYQQIREECR